MSMCAFVIASDELFCPETPIVRPLSLRAVLHH